jgi:hypothetical protein
MNQDLFVESLQLGEFGQSISTPLKDHLDGDRTLTCDWLDQGSLENIGFDLQNKGNETVSVSKS